MQAMSPDKRGDLFAIEPPQFGEVREERATHDGCDPQIFRPALNLAGTRLPVRCARNLSSLWLPHAEIVVFVNRLADCRLPAF